MALPKVQDADSSVVAVYNDNIKQVLASFMDTYNIDDLKQVKPLQFNALLKYICQNIFIRNGCNTLKDNNHINTWDLDKISEVEDIYINLCEITVHSCSVYGLSCITGIDYGTLSMWKTLDDNGNEATLKRIEIIKKITRTREVHESNRIEGTTIGDIAILNHEYSWSNPIQQSEEHKRAVTLDDIPRLSDSST